MSFPNKKNTLRTRLAVAFGDLFVDDDVSFELLVKQLLLSQKKGVDIGQPKEVGNYGDEDNADEEKQATMLPATAVVGQTIVGLFDADFDTEHLRDESRFTNGDMVDLEHYLHSLMESPSNKADSNRFFMKNC